MSVEQSQIEQATAVVVHPIDEVRLAVARFDRVAAGIADLKAKYAAVVFDVTTSKGMKDAATARAAIRSVRVEVEKVRKDCKAPVLALGREIDARAAAITPELLAIEEPIDQQIKAEEARKEEERKAKIEAERKRVAAIHARIDAIKATPAGVANRDAAKMDSAIRHMVALEIDASFQEFQATATEAREYVLTKLRQMLTDRLAHEAELDRLRLEREELARQRAEQEQANIEARRRIAIQEAEALAKRQAEEAERQRQIDESMAKLRAEREQRDRENAERAERQRLEDEQRATEHSRQLQLIAREQALQESRWAEINAMGHQVMIAITGRLGVREGGTRECMAETHAETAAWEVTEAKFGPLFPVALSARQTACDAIARELQAWDANAASDRLLAEQARVLAATERPVCDLLPFDGSGDTGVFTDADGSTLAIVQGHEIRPTANDIAQLVSTDYGVGFDRAMAWCVNAFQQDRE